MRRVSLFPLSMDAGVEDRTHIRILRVRSGDCQVVLATCFGNSEQVRACRQAGIRGFRRFNGIGIGRVFA
jgi:DNA-binding NarL/FixJ family response regulator